MQKTPCLFIPHGGGPCFFMDWSPPQTWHHMRDFLCGLAQTLPAKPKAIVLISAHWEAPVFTIQNNDAPELLFDYGGFPAHTYQLTYPAAGSPTLAAQIADLLTRSGIAWAYDDQRGFDHGVFIPLKLVFPEADIPIVQVSLKTGLDPAEHLAMGEVLAPLREQGVLIMGSGMSYHNMHTLMRHMHSDTPAKTTADSQGFDAWLTEVMTSNDLNKRQQALMNWQQAPHARSAHPREEHLLPLQVIAGVGCNDQGMKIFTDTVLGAVVSAFRLG